jgi:hypothetical protein
MTTWFNHEWPWYVAGPVIGLFVPALLIVGNRVFGISGSLSHLCAAIAPGKIASSTKMSWMPLHPPA